jgi:tRNA threonylcarbamoyladenosine biosynthesis protein TsaE
MTTLEYLFSLDEIDDIAQKLYDLRHRCAIFTFTGSLGAGKTTLIKVLLKKWGVVEPVTSPTFTYVNAYQNDSDELLYHFDLYRLTTLDQFLDAGFDELLYLPRSWAFIEWPEIIEPLLARQICRVKIMYESPESRRVTVTVS